MNRIIILVFILVTLSTVNTIPHKLYKRDTIFQPCSEGPFINVTVSPDPPVAGGSETFDISGTAESTINEGENLVIIFADVSNDPPEPIGEPFSQQFCSADVQCPVESGTEYKTSAEVQVPQTLPDSYAIIVGIASMSSDDNAVISGCAIGVVGESLPASSPSASPSESPSASPSTSPSAPNLAALLRG